MARAREIELSAEMPYAEAAVQTITVRAEELVEHAGDVLDTGDIERLHDMRVATRRLRAALEVFEPCFAGKPYKSALRQVKKLADALGERRDRDVTIRGLRGFASEMAAPDQRGIGALIETLGEEQDDANEALRPMVSPERVEALRDELAKLALTARSADGETA